MQHLLLTLLLVTLTTLSSAWAVSTPKVILLIDEKNFGSLPTGEVEGIAAAMLIEKGISVVDTEMVRANLEKDQALLDMAGDIRGSASLGLQFGASIVISGSVVVKPSAGRIAETQLRSYQAVATLRAIRTDNAKVLTSISERATVADVDDVSGSSKALEKAGRKALATLLPKMESQWKVTATSTGGSETIEVSVGGLDQIWKLKSVRDRLRNDKEVMQNVTQQSYTAGTAHFSLDSSLPAERLAEQLVIRPPEGLKCQILEIARGKLTIKVAPVQ